MKRVVISRSLPLACLLASGLGLSAFAQAAAPAASAATAAAVPVTGATKIAVINFQAAVGATNEGQRNLSEVQKKYEPKQTQLKTQNDEIDSLKKQLQAAGDKLSDTERQTRMKSIDEKEKSLQRSVEDAQNDYQQDMQQTFAQLAEKVFAVVQSYATQNGFQVVLDTATAQQQSPTVLWYTQGTDITRAVIDAYNTKSGIPAPANVPSAPAPAAHTGAAARPSSPK
jgi:outer membrane protein